MGEPVAPDSLVARLRSFPQFTSLDGSRWYRQTSFEPLCQDAADRIEQLIVALDRANELRLAVMADYELLQQAADAMRSALVDTDYELLDDHERHAVDVYDAVRKG